MSEWSTEGRTPQQPSGIALVVAMIAAFIGLVAALVFLGGIFYPEIGARLGYQTITPRMMFGSLLVMILAMSVSQGIIRSEL